MSSVRGAAGIVVLLGVSPCVSVSANTPQFLRGDVNMSGTREITDAVVIFSLSGQVGFVLDPVDVAAFGVGKIVAALES